MKNIKQQLVVIVSFITLIMLVSGCGNNEYTPKPRGYFRIGLPEKKYLLFDSTYPYSFERPVYSHLVPDKDANSEPYWANLVFPEFSGVLHLSYKPVKNDLYQYFEDAHNLASKHIPKADDIIPLEISVPEHKVYGLLYDIPGVGVASSYQFCVTDSVHHFLRGALYFNVYPNNDSLAPVLDFIKSDIDHLISTIRWKDQN